MPSTAALTSVLGFVEGLLTAGFPPVGLEVVIVIAFARIAFPVTESLESRPFLVTLAFFAVFRLSRRVDSRSEFSSTLDMSEGHRANLPYREVTSGGVLPVSQQSSL